MSNRIAVFRALQLGDLLVAVPALRALRAQFPQAEITLIGLPWAKLFVQRFHHYVDRFVEFPGYPGIDEALFDPERTERFLVAERSYNYDLVIQMHGSGRTSHYFVLALNGAATFGYYENTPDGLTFGTVYPENQHEIWRNLHLAALVGCTDLDTSLEFPLFQQDHAEAHALFSMCKSGNPVIGIHPGARPPARRWPVDYFAAVADKLAQRYDAQILVTGGPGEETTVQAVVERMRTSATNLCGKTSLGSLAALISRLDLFISNDTGPAHIACAVDTPSVTIFGPADVQRWAPLDTVHHPGVRRPVVCSPCGYWECPIDHRCLRWLSPADDRMVLDVWAGASVGLQRPYLLSARLAGQARTTPGPLAVR